MYGSWLKISYIDFFIFAFMANASALTDAQSYGTYYVLGPFSVKSRQCFPKPCKSPTHNCRRELCGTVGGEFLITHPSVSSCSDYDFLVLVHMLSYQLPIPIRIHRLRFPHFVSLGSHTRRKQSSLRRARRYGCTQSSSEMAPFRSSQLPKRVR